MTTENVIAILIFIICFIGGYWWGKATKKTSNTTEKDKALSAGLVGCVIQIGNLREDIHKLRNFLTSQASESSKKIDWEPDDYKDPYSGVPDKIEKAFKENNFKDRAGPKHRRFDEDELHEVSHMLKDHELREFGG